MHFVLIAGGCIARLHEALGLARVGVHSAETPMRRTGFAMCGRLIERSEDSSELVEKYKKRFQRYRESLFRFLEEDGIPWNNNMAERALRHLSVQQKISGCFFGQSGADNYLRLLAISQTCRFQDKPFLDFLLSGERDVDQFKPVRRRRKPRLS